jgi:hypothetical protein
MTFHTVTKWEEWYKHYSFLMGFGVRREDIKTDRNGKVIARKWVCSKEGFKGQQVMKKTEANAKNDP